jgi:predicted PP-loop superfamily ATPase
MLVLLSCYVTVVRKSVQMKNVLWHKLYLTIHHMKSFLHICQGYFKEGNYCKAKEETVLQGIIDRLIEIGRCHGMDMNVERTRVMRISRQPSPVKT